MPENCLLRTTKSEQKGTTQALTDAHQDAKDKKEDNINQNGINLIINFPYLISFFMSIF